MRTNLHTRAYKSVRSSKIWWMNGWGNQIVQIPKLLLTFAKQGGGSRRRFLKVLIGSHTLRLTVTNSFSIEEFSPYELLYSHFPGNNNDDNEEDKYVY